jgi:hypothetical protein
MSTPEQLVRLATDDGGLLVRASSIQMENTEFPYTPTVPFGALTISAGLGGLGKSQLAIWTAARASRGQLPGDVEGTPISVILATAEDGHAQTMVPRLKAAGADLDRVHLVVLDSGFQIPDDLPRLERAVEHTGARFLVIDPLVAFIPVRLDSHKDQHARAALSPLAALASSHRLAIEAVMHLNKAQEGHALFLRVSSSIGFLNAARSAVLVATDPDDETARIMAHGKANLSAPGPSMRFRIEEVCLDDTDPRTGERIRTSRIVWLGESHHTIADLLETDRRADPRNRAEAWLSSQLASGPKLVSVLKALARDAGHSWRTIERAKADLGIEASKDGFQGPWRWSLDGQSPPFPSSEANWRPLGDAEGGTAGQDEDRHVSPDQGGLWNGGLR